MKQQVTLLHLGFLLPSFVYRLVRIIWENTLKRFSSVLGKQKENRRHQKLSTTLSWLQLLAETSVLHPPQNLNYSSTWRRNQEKQKCCFYFFGFPFFELHSVTTPAGPTVSARL